MVKRSNIRRKARNLILIQERRKIRRKSGKWNHLMINKKKVK